MKIHVKNPTTTTLVPPTDYVYYYEPYLPFDFSYEDYITIDPATFDTLKTIEYWIVFINDISNYPGLIFNVLHWIILTRKELKKTPVFFVMLGICTWDVLVFLTGILDSNVTNHIAYLFYCGSTADMWIAGFNWFFRGIQKFGRLGATIFVLLMTFIRALSLLLPLNNTVSLLTTFKSTVISMMVTIIPVGAWYASLYGRVKLEIRPGTCYWFIIRELYDEEISRAVTEGFIVLALTFLYFILTVLLLIAIWKAKMRRREMGSANTDNTTALVTGMAVSFLLANIGYSVIFIYNNYPYPEGTFPIIRMSIGATLRDLPQTLQSWNSITHCFLCFFMSSQYRGVVLRITGMERFFRRDTVDIVKSTA
ncbi:unnamed protein product [Caenorhabditis nigoni]